MSRPRILESYLVTADYQSTDEGHVTLKEGHFVQVIEKNINGKERGEQRPKSVVTFLKFHIQTPVTRILRYALFDVYSFVIRR